MRSRQTRERAERALVRFALRLGARRDSLVVVGGLNPELLAPVPDAPHQGTADIDLVIQIGMVYDRDELDFGWLEAALLAAEFLPLSDGQAWQWVTTVDTAPVRVDLLTDALDHRGQQLALPGCDRTTVMNVAGPGPALRDPVLRRLPVAPSDADVRDTPFVDVPFANLGGYLLAKSAAVLGRTADRDPYDLAFVVAHNSAGGPQAAARAAHAALPPRRDREFSAGFRAALARLTDPLGAAARTYAEQRVLDGDGLPVDVLAADAAAAASQCLREFDRLSGTT
ncbi:hypothetical protein [Cellulomonas sp. S1-8]|uniref:hypothetical protein n=1 Tax=Cellulomonas sp. S1-8 TaxID=2904790 RepID=UPI002243F234|nr:hypothetical protein [Cellulomonas sp. S1-8]UZN03036.1 hypothetical protein OKX07_18600 [Cellulomonas sp. S1-8]